MEVEDEYYEDDLGASHGDQDVPSEDLTEESDIERNTKSWSTMHVHVKQLLKIIVFYIQLDTSNTK